MAAALTSDNQDYIESRIGRAAEPVDLYLAHFLGSAGAVRFLSAWADTPEQAGAPMMPDAAAAPRSVFYAADGNTPSPGATCATLRAQLDHGGRRPGTSATASGTRRKR